MITVTCTFIHSRLCLILQQDQDHNYYIQISQAERPTFLRTRQLRPLLTPCEPLWPTMMMLSKLSRASSARPQQPLFRPRFTSQSFNRSIRTPRYRAKDTKLPQTPDGELLNDLVAVIGGHYSRGFSPSIFSKPLLKQPVQTVVPSNEPEPDHKITPHEDVVASGTEEKSGQWGRQIAPFCRPDYNQSQGKEWRRGSDGRPADSGRTVPAQLPAELLHHK
jgi:hypothetical protein